MGLFPFVNNSKHFRDFLEFIFFFLVGWNCIPNCKRIFLECNFQKRCIGEISRLDFEEEKMFASLPYKGLSEPLPFHVSNGFW